MDDSERLAKLARHVAAVVENGMTLGLGSGRTAEAVLRELGARVASGLRVTGVPTSDRTGELARKLGVPVLALDDVAHIDLGIDGADEIDPSLNVVKGRGGALLHEKLVALACDRLLIVAASEKLVHQLGMRMPLPVEVIPFGWRHTATRLETLGFRPMLRYDPGGTTPYSTDNGHYILDCVTGPIADPKALAATVKAVTGVVEHGLFVDFADQAIVISLSGELEHLEKPLENPD